MIRDMPNQKILVPIIIVVTLAVAILFFGADFFSVGAPPENPNQPVACTQDAKMCPDGSYVGRVAPSCDFAACPTTTPDVVVAPQAVLVQAKLNESSGGFNAHIVPLSLVEDSRCPVDVTCIQAGTVRVRTQVENANGTNVMTLTLNTPVTIGAEMIELTEVMPVKNSKVTVKPTDYTFVFKVTKVQ
jgi:hypothetical protein